MGFCYVCTFRGGYGEENSTGLLLAKAGQVQKRTTVALADMTTQQGGVVDGRRSLACVACARSNRGRDKTACV